MANGKRAAAVVWRTVVCAAIVPGCRHDAAKPAAPASCEDPPIAMTDTEADGGDREDGQITIHVTSTPPGATVEVDGEDAPRGVTPIDLVFDVEPRDEMFDVTLDGYERGRDVISLSEDVDRDVHFDLVDDATAAARPRCPDDDEPRHFDIGFIVS